MRRKPKPPSPPPVEKAPEKLARPFADALAGLAKRAAEEARAPRAAEPTPKPDAGSKPKPSPKAKPAPAADGGAP